VIVTGVLTADDMRRLEHACREALTVDPPTLTLELQDVRAIDRSALAVLRHLESRGAILEGPTLASIPPHEEATGARMIKRARAVPLRPRRHRSA
jgi:hypothetical protein